MAAPSVWFILKGEFATQEKLFRVIHCSTCILTTHIRVPSLRVPLKVSARRARILSLKYLNTLLVIFKYLDQALRLSLLSQLLASIPSLCPPSK